ncbi:hypothetical protein Glove_568g7 [Diversispora epigaea]|uniref:Uncharacterized protein n=1 Tax=Diversispora epigaea TaxID=1348612 RepID=A0A397GI78_9GLOM|nr:hypothetical protein Glove_568g7 [Diversispora epigaea]
MHECIEGYPVFLPARSMAQADYMEVLERVKKANSLSQHEKLKELVEIVKQKEKEREEKEREWVEKHQHPRMLLTSSEEDNNKDTIEIKKVGVKIGKKSKSVSNQNKNGNTVAPVIGIDGQRHHPCCPLAPGNHSTQKDHIHNHNHSSSSSSFSSSSSSSSGSSSASSNNVNTNCNGNPGGPRQYPLHTQRADSVMMWLRAVILRPEKSNEVKTNKPMTSNEILNRENNNHFEVKTNGEGNATEFDTK